MFSKSQRITKKKDFDLIFKKGKVFYSPFFTIRILKNDLNTQRFTVLVSKKVSKKAVDRNKIKRILREAIKKNQKIFPSNSDSVLYTQPKAIKLSYTNATKIIQKMLKKPIN